MNYAIFVYGGDAAALRICIDQVRRVDDEAHFYLFDDGRWPLEAEDVPEGDDVTHEVTWFDRRGNLNGLECMRGMLGCMYRIPGEGAVVKLDADTLLMDKAEIERSLEERGKLAGGMQCSVGLGWAGCCYWLTKRAIREGLEVLVRREWPEGKDGYPEDIWVTRVMTWLYGRRGVDIIEFDGGRRLIGVRSVDGRDLREIARLARQGVCAVHCGQMRFYGGVAERYGCGIRGACARVMAAVLRGDGEV